jgi:hypothetical protein
MSLKTYPNSKSNRVEIILSIRILYAHGKNIKINKVNADDIHPVFKFLNLVSETKYKFQPDIVIIKKNRG